MTTKKVAASETTPMLVRLSLEEKTLISAAAARRGMSMNSFVRRACARAASLVLKADDDLLDPVLAEGRDAA